MKGFPLAHRAEKWIRFSLARPAGSAFNDVPAKGRSIGFDPKSGSTFGSDALALILRAAGGGVSKDEGVSSVLWTLLRDGRFATSSG